MNTAFRSTARLLRGRRFATALAIVLSLAAVYTLLGFFAAPVLLEHLIVDYAATRLERKAAVGRVRVNPLLLKLDIEDFTLAERDGRPILGFARLVVDFEAASLVRRAWTFSEIALERPDLHADIGPDGKLNLVALLEKLPRTERRPDEKLPRVLLQRVAWRAGTITFSDRSGSTPARSVINPADVELNDISTLPDHRGAWSVSARLVDGGAVAWRGDVSLDTLSSQGEIGVKGVKPATAWRFLQDRLAISEPRGELDFSAHYRFAIAKGAPQLAIDGARFAGRGIALAMADGKEPILALDSIEVTGGRLDLAAREFSLSAVELRDGTLAVDVDPQRAINWGKLLRAQPAAARPVSQVASPASAAELPPWKGRLESLRVTGMRLNYTDRSRKKPLQVDVKDVTLRLAADVVVRPGAGAQAVLEGVALQLAQASARDLGAPEALAVFDAIALEGGRLGVEEREVSLGRIAVNGGVVKVVHGRDGAVELLERLKGEDAGLVRREVRDVLKEARAEGRPWRFAVDSLEIAGVRVPVVSHGYAEPIVYDGEDLRARMTGFRSDGKDPVKIEASVRFAQGGTVAASGALRLSGDELNARVKIDGFALRPLQPFIFSRGRAGLASGGLTADMKVDYRVRGGRHEFRATGLARVDNFRLNEAEGGERLISWSSLAANGISLSLAPDDLKVDEVRITGMDSKVIVYKDRSVNLMKAITLESGAAGGEAAPATIADVEARFPVSIGRILFEKGMVDFADLSLVLPFAAKVQDLEGTIQGASTERTSRATVRLEGRVDEYGLARVNGSLRPFQPRSFLDLNVVFRNVEMPPLSPYSVTFAGRRIASGRLALDLQYKINDGMLAGDNRVVLEKFTLGERVEAPGALNLPLDLAVALLTDSDGKIDLAVPVHGNVNDPKFSYGEVIWQAVSNLITRIVTAPFRALAALFGGSGAEQLENVAFDPGRATLLPPEREKLKHVAEGLARRPQLRVVAEGQYGPADRAALQRRNVELAVSATLGRAPAEGKEPDPLDVTDAKTQRALEAIFVERNSDQALSEFASQSGKARGRPVDRVNVALALIGRGSSDREFYEALFKRLCDTAPLPDAALAQLAGERARAVAGHLSTVLAVPPARAEARTASAPGAAQVRLAFEAAPAAAPDKGGGQQ